jgi:predicted NBD/HSP70 family sugar kinase/DNA-binding MarR family transcriptional regulator
MVNLFDLSTRLGGRLVNKFELKSLLTDRALDTPTGRIVRTLSERGALSATQISRLTGLAKSTVSMALAELRRSEMVVEVGSESAGNVGRPATALTLNPKAGTCIGILIGQTEVQVILADVSHSVLYDRTVRHDLDYPPDIATADVRRLIEEAYDGQSFRRDGLLGVGIAVGGPVNPVNGQVLRAGGMPTWAGVDMRQLFGSMFEGVPIFADNESNCSAIAEMTWGAAQGHDDFIVYTLDLGVGGAIVSGGRVLRGIAGGAGEFGHVVLDPEGPPCRCGNRGCIEVYASFRERLKQAERHFGRSLRVADVVELALAGDMTCRALIEDAGQAGGHGLGLIGSVFNPTLVVVSGRLATAGDILMKPLADSFERYTLVKRGDVPEDARTILRRSRFTDNGACMGAVGLVLRHHGRLLN